MFVQSWKCLGVSLLACAWLACSTSESPGGDDDETVDGSMPTGTSDAGHGGGDAAIDAAGDASMTMRMTNDAGQCVSSCHEGDACTTGAECASGACIGDVCVDPSCTDGQKDGTETATDCGGICQACADGLACLVDADCGSKSCDSQAHVCLKPTDTDKIQNGNETGIDCGSGGPGENTMAPPCADGVACVSGADCVDKVCTAMICAASSCGDGEQNGSETGVDCGDPAVTGCQACGDGLGCKVGTDCTSLSCDQAAGMCLAPTDSDGILNGNESDVDCGSSGTGESTKAPPCPDVNKTTGKVSVCGAAADCKSTFCNTVQKQCVDGRSCSLPIPTKSSPIQDISVPAVQTGTKKADAQGVLNVNGTGLTAGIDTCGKGEATDPANLTAHDSCCKSLDVTIPAESNAAIRIDKYEVTAGRMRQFVEAVSALEVTAGNGAYNLRKWVTDQIAAATPAGLTMAAQFPTTQQGATDTRALFPAAYTGALGMIGQLGGTSMDNGDPSDFQGCYMGIGEGAGSTYWFDMADSAQLSSPPRAFTQDYYDIKSMNCTPYWMAVAFCAWDGGQIPTQAEFDHLWGTATYPWGTASRTYMTLGAPPAGTLITDWTIDNLNNDYTDKNGATAFFYNYPAANGDSKSMPSNPATGPLGYASIPDTIVASANDETPWIAAPGRFTPDVTSLTATTGTVWAGESWNDLAANMMEFQAIPPANFAPSGDTGIFCDTSVGSQVAEGDTCPAQYNCSRDHTTYVSCGVVRGGVMPVSQWTGGSWEVHAIVENHFKEDMQTQYGKAGFRCARPAE